MWMMLTLYIYIYIYIYDVRDLVRPMNVELKNLSILFCANSISLSTDETMFGFIRLKVKTNLLLFSQIYVLVMLKTKQEKSVKFLGVMIDENLT